MTENKIFRTLKKLIPFIVIGSLLISLAVNYFLRQKRQYIASEVIKYVYDTAADGLTPSGVTLDVNEIKSSSIMTKVLDNLGLSGVYSVDSLTSRISITEVLTEDEASLKAAMIDDGEEYTAKPTTFIITFTATNSEGIDFARTMLDEIVDTYFQVFGENYVSVSHISNQLDKLMQYNYDYLEMAEYIDSCITDTMNQLYTRNDTSKFYRSSQTGYSFTDLINEFQFIQDSELKDVLSSIFEYRISKNKQILISNYQNRIDQNTITSKNYKKNVSDIDDIMDAYVGKMENFGNTDSSYDYNYILDDVYDTDPTGTGTIADQTVTYDQLIYDWVEYNISDSLAQIDSEYCQYVIDTFSSTPSTLTDIEQETAEAEVSSRISNIISKLTNLYSITISTNNEYNKYLGCSNISLLSTVSTSTSVNVTLYTAIIFIFLVIVCSGVAILVSRLNDIMIAAFYTDELTKFRNRQYFDKYLKQKGRSNLDAGTFMISAVISNQRDINIAFDRDTGNGVIKLFADTLREAFARMNAMFIYNDGSHFIITLEKTDAGTVDDALQLFQMELNERHEYDNVEIQYKVGVSETTRDRVNTARVLLVSAMKNYKEYTSAAKVQKQD